MTAQARPTANALIFLAHLGLAGLWIALASRSGSPGVWLSVAVLQAAAGITLGLLNLKKARPLTLILLPPALVWLGGLTAAAVSLAALARHIPRVHPLGVTSAWYAGLGRIELPLSSATWLASFGFLAAMTTLVAPARARRAGFHVVAPVGALVFGLVAFFATSAVPILDSGSIALGAGLLLAVLIGDAPVQERLGAGLALVSAVFCASEAEVLWARAGLLAILEAERDVGALSVSGGLERLATVEDAALRSVVLIAAAVGATFALVVVPRARPGTEMWRRPLAAFGVALLALPIGFAVKAGRDARSVGAARAIEAEAQMADPGLPTGGNRDRVEMAPLLELRGERAKIAGAEMPLSALDDAVLLKEAIGSARAQLYERVHEDLPSNAGWRPAPGRATLVVAVQADSSARTLFEVLRKLKAAGVVEAQLLLHRTPPGAGHPLAGLSELTGIRPGLDVPRTIPVSLSDAPANARLDDAGLHFGDAPPMSDLRGALGVAERVGRSKVTTLVLDVQGGSAQDLVRVLDPTRAILQLPVAVSFAAEEP